MKVFRLDLPCGEYYTLNEKELKQEFTETEIENFRNDPQVIFIELNVTIKQLEKARELRNDDEYCLKFEDKYDMQASVYDILKVKYIKSIKNV